MPESPFMENLHKMALEAVGHQLNRSVAAYLFGVGISSSETLRQSMIPSIINSRQAQPTCTDAGRCAPPPDLSLLWCKNPPTAYPDPRIGETA